MASLSAHGLANFKYEGIDPNSSKPFFRLVVLHSGIRGSSIRMTLVRAAFADRPSYEALSYTWGSPKTLKGIELNGIRVDIRQNLWDALIHLRSTMRSNTEGRVLWIDAICINQNNLEERNRQVELMAHIYTRATKVLVWLGIINTFASKEGGPEDSEYDTHTLVCQPYWRRVWIVQEIGAATILEVNWGLRAAKSDVNWESKTKDWDAFFRPLQSKEGHSSLARDLADQRDGRHGDSYLLANLIEVCKHSLCEEPRDKIYGFVGIAHDCQDGTFPVDYSKTLFQLYEDAVRFQYRASAISHKSLIHFSQLVQESLGGPAAMRRDLTAAGFELLEIFGPTILTPKDKLELFRVNGVYCGYISNLGCSYDDFVAIPDATRNWKVALMKSQANNVEAIRRKNEGFMRTLLDLNKVALDRIHPVYSSFSWKGSKAMYDIMGVKMPSTNSEWEMVPNVKSNVVGASSTQGADASRPHLFATPKGDIGLVPGNACVGDVLYQFWDTDVVAVVRLEDNHHVKIIGRAAISNDEYTSSKFYAPRDLEPEEGNWETKRNPPKLKGLNFEKGVDLYMDIWTLQMLTE